MNTIRWHSSRWYGMLILVGLLFSVYTMSSAGRFHIVDEVSLFAVTESVALRAEVDTNAIAWTQWVNSPGEVLGAFGPDGEVYSKKGPAPAFLAVPWYTMLRGLAQLDFTVGLLQGTLLWNGLVTALTAALLWLTALRLGYGERMGAMLALLFGLSTIAWPYANQFFGEPISAFSLLLAYFGLLSWRAHPTVGWALTAGVGAGLALATVTAHSLLVALLGLYLLGAWWQAPAEAGTQASERRDLPTLLKAVAGFALPVLIAGGLLLWYNSARFGAPFDTGYHFDSGEGFTTPIWQGFWGLVLSPYRGLFWHTPLFLASLAGFVPFLRRHRLDALLIGAMSVTLVGLYSMWWMWWGGFAWGPRFLVPLSPFWVLLLAPLLDSIIHAEDKSLGTGSWRLSLSNWVAGLGVRGWLLMGLIAVSTLVQISAVIVNYVNFEIQLRGIFPTNWEDPLEFGPPAQGISDFPHSPVIGQWRLMADNFVVNTDLAWLWADGNIQWLVLLVGGATVATLGFAMAVWFLYGPREERASQVAGRPFRVLVAALPLILAATWMGQTSRSPHYGLENQGYQAALQEICTQAKTDDVLVTVAPFSYQVPMNWMPSLCRAAMPIYGYATNSLDHPEAQMVMERLLETHPRIWFVTAGLPPSAPENSLEQRLAQEAYKANDVWYNDFRLVRYATAERLADVEYTSFSIPLTGVDDQVVTIQAARAPQTIPAGAILPIDIRYEVVTPVESNFRWFVQLISPEGYPVALLDTLPDDGYAAFPTQPINTLLMERAGLQIPDGSPPGIYQLIAGLYDPDAENAARLTTPNGSDFVEIGKIEVR